MLRPYTVRRQFLLLPIIKQSCAKFHRSFPDLTPWPSRLRGTGSLLIGAGEILAPFCGLNSPSLLKRRGRGMSSLALVKICIVFNNSLQSQSTLNVAFNYFNYVFLVLIIKFLKIIFRELINTPHQECISNLSLESANFHDITFNLYIQY